VGVVGYLALLPGAVLLYYFAGVANVTLVHALMIISFAALILPLVAARAADQKMGPGQQGGDGRVHHDRFGLQAPSG
jgi:hypothetical protein